MTGILLIVLAVANWRLAHFIAEEGGPWDFMDYFRVALTGVRYDEYNQPYGTNVVSQGVLCIWCNSFWIGIIQAIITLALPEISLWLFLPFALSGFAIAMDSLVGD